MFMRRFICRVRQGHINHVYIPHTKTESGHLRKTLIRMSSTVKSDHLQRTAHNTRQEIVSPATVLRIKDESPTVKSLDLKISNPDFTFKAGQWVDTHIPGVEKVGGFSMCSSPALLHTEGILQLAVKNSPHPPAHWVHTKCKEGDKVELRVGGDYFYSPQTDTPPHSLLLVAGGVGINPLISMLKHIADLHSTEGQVFRPKKVILMYSSKTVDELLFREKIQRLCDDEKNNMASMFFVTADTCSETDIKCNRIEEADVQKAVEELRPDSIECYLCGPSPMIENIEAMLTQCGVKDSSIHYERWW